MLSNTLALQYQRHTHAESRDLYGARATGRSYAAGNQNAAKLFSLIYYTSTRNLGSVGEKSPYAQNPTLRLKA